MNILKREIIMSAKIDYNFNARQQGHTITPKTNLNSDFHISLEDEIKDVISSRLPSDMAQIYGLTIKTRMITTRYSSITVFFGVLLSGFTLIANYKGFYDSIQLIREHLKLLLAGRLHEKSGEDFDITVSIEQPQLDNPRESHFPIDLRRFSKHMHFDPEFAEVLGLWQLTALQRHKRRDAFFWFLLIFCILLIAILGLLVFAAVKKTYFP